MRWLTISAFFFAGLTVLAASEKPARFDHPHDGVRSKAADRLGEAIQSTRARNLAPETMRGALREAIREAAEILGADSFAAKRLKSAAEQVASAPAIRFERDLDSLRAQLAELAKDLSFRPRKEADLPRDFPPPTPVGDVEIKNYPGHRKAETPGDSDLAFWTLFEHIKRNGIEMTAPVELTSSSESPGPTAGGRMAFLYGDGSLGRAGVEGRVVVSDVPATTVVSTGVRGPQNQDTVRQARERLDAWLEWNRASWTAAGSVRVMGYNSPFVPRDENYFEVQIPVRNARSNQE